MRFSFTLFLFVLVFGLQAQQSYNNGWGNGPKVRGNGEVVTKDRSVKSFDGVQVCCGMRVELTEGSNFSVQVEAESNIQEYVRTEVSGGRLEIGFTKKVNLKTTERIVVYVTLPRLEYVGVSSGSRLVGMTPFSGEDLELEASSGSKVSLEFSGDRVRANASSAGRVELKGTGTSIKANASSGASVRAGDFAAKRGDANASSGGGITVNVSEELEADASSGGGVKYHGNPTNVDSDRSSGGSVRRAN